MPKRLKVTGKAFTGYQILIFSAKYRSDNVAFHKFFTKKFITMPKKFNVIREKVVSLCEAEPAITAAYIFGSYAKGKGKKSSDVDVALLLNEKKISGFSPLDFITMLEKQLGCKADVVILNKADEVLKYEVRRQGKLIYERSEEYRKQFEVKGRKSYEDFLYLHNRYVKSVLYGGTNGQSGPP